VLYACKVFHLITKHPAGFQRSPSGRKIRTASEPDPRPDAPTRGNNGVPFPSRTGKCSYLHEINQNELTRFFSQLLPHSVFPIDRFPNSGTTSDGSP
jgi:hypothetical protein